MSAFAQVPIQVIQDSRLTLEQLRVLIALLSFGSKDGGSVWPKRALIAERTGMHPANISAATSALVKLGWLEKVGRGGFSKSACYTLKLPTTVADQVAHSATSTVAHSATSTVAHSATRKEQTIEQTKEQTKTYKRKPALVCPDDVPESVWADFLTIRKAKRAPMTATALQSIQREADKAGISIADALATCCERGWQSFKAEWAAPTRPSARRVPAAENFAAKDYGTGGLI